MFNVWCVEGPGHLLVPHVSPHPGAAHRSPGAWGGLGGGSVGGGPLAIHSAVQAAGDRCAPVVHDDHGGVSAAEDRLG